jgi:carbamoyltransferase
MRHLFLGVNAYFHDSALAVVEGGQVVFAAQEERFTRVKYDNSAPRNALRAALRYLGTRVDQIAALAYYEDPGAKMERILATLPQHDREDSFCQRWDVLHHPVRLLATELGWRGETHTFEHHRCHAAYSFFSSGLHSALILINDGVGEWDSSTVWRASGSDLKLLAKIRFPHSLGLFYACITAFLGFRPNADEYKIMGMAPYGNPRLISAMRRLLHVSGGGYSLGIELLDVFDMRNTGRIADVLGIPARMRGEPLEQEHFDVAASAQHLLQECLLAQCAHYKDVTRERNLCLGGGVALNCVANGVIERSLGFETVWVPPAADDPGNAVGAAYLLSVAHGISPRPLTSAHLGVDADDESARAYLGAIGARYHRLEDDALQRGVASLLEAGNVVGWFRGRAEFGARALGARSILADPRRGDMRDHVNAKIKNREKFRPFAPVCFADRAAEYFDAPHELPFMTSVCRTRDPSLLPAVSHVDGTARLQTIARGGDSPLAGLLAAFEKATGVPVLLNTSFNLADEPIVGSAADAFNSFRDSGIDVLVIGSQLLLRSEQPPALLQKGTFDRLQIGRRRAPHAHHTYFFA